MLLARGNCSFLHKIRAMQQSGAVAVIVGDNRQQSELITMYADGPAGDITISSTFVDSVTYGYLYKMADWQAYTPNANPKEGVVKIIPNAINYESLLRSFFSLAPWLFLFCIVIYTIAQGALARRRRNRYLLNAGLRDSSGSFGDFGRRGGRRFSNDTISVVQVNHNLNNLSSKQFFLKEIKENDSSCCAICLEDFEDAQSLIVLSCNHSYHPDCIKAWLIKRTPHLCPICKKEVTCSCSSDEEQVEEDEQGVSFDADQLAHLGVAAIATIRNTPDSLSQSVALTPSSPASSPTTGEDESDPLVIRRRPGGNNENNASSSSTVNAATTTAMSWTSWQAIRGGWRSLYTSAANTRQEEQVRDDTQQV
jgi:hypothetical protein